MYPEKMTTEQLAEAMDEIAENMVQEVMLDLQSGNIHYYVSYLKDIVDEECDLSVRAGVFMERLKAYEPELPKDMEPMVYVNYCEKSELGNPRCKKLSDLDSKTVEQDKAWYADRDPNTNEPKTTIHERLEINKRIIQEKQGKDKPERGADLGVRTA